MGKKVVLIILAVVGVGAVVGGILLLRNTNPKSPDFAKATSGEQVPNPSLEQPVVPATEEGEMTGVSEKTVEITVEGSSYKFVPAQIKVKKGDVVKLTFKNVGGTHDLVIDEFDVKTNQIGEGEEEEVEFVASKTGTFAYYCSFGNHRKMGMEGTIVVE